MVDLPMELNTPMIESNYFGGEMRNKAKRTLKYDEEVALHPALLAAGSSDRTHQQEMVNMINKDRDRHTQTCYLISHTN